MKKKTTAAIHPSLKEKLRIKRIELSGLCRLSLHLAGFKPSHKKKTVEAAPCGKSESRNITAVSRHQCIGCGLCFSVCSFNAITMTHDDSGFIPQLHQSSCTQCGLCLKVCPGINILEYPGTLGTIEKTIVTHAKDPEVRHNASSGGTCRSILISLLEKKIVDSVIITRATDDPYMPETIITDSAEDLSDERLNSIYSPTSPLSALKGLDKNKKYAFVGLPCHIAGLTLAPHIKKHIHATIGIFCSHTPGFDFLNCFIHDVSHEGGIQRISYRGDGWPGKTTLHFADGGSAGMRFPAMWHRYNYGKQFQQSRCSTCTYYSAEFADISIGDPWSLAGKDSEGLSLVFIRSTRGMEIVEAAMDRIDAEEIAGTKKDEILKFHISSALSKLKKRTAGCGK
jgi:coenzyme F420 hydrogenase subunit beta